MKKTILAMWLLLVTAVAFAQGRSSDAIPYGSNAKAGKYAEIRGINMYYETYGQGEPLLIIHGNSGSIADFQYQVPYFSQQYKVIVADSRDHGRTLDTLHMNDSLSYEMMADDYAALLNTLHIDSCYVLGWSDGGINGLLLSIRHPEKVKKLAVMGANLWPDTTAIDPFILKYFSQYNTMLKLGPEGTERTVLLRHFNLLLHQPHIQPAELQQVKCPTLVIAGDHDLVRVPHTVLIAQSIPQANLWIAPNAGHGLPVFGYKDKFNKEVAEFFTRPYQKIEKLSMFNN